MFLILLEIVLVILVICFFVTQVIIPLLSGTRILPAFRSQGKKALIKDMILDEKDKIEEEELRHSLSEMRQKEKGKKDE
jgi:hypothetical protein